MQKYIGRTVEIIYLDQHGKITLRQIRVHCVQDGLVRAYCFAAKAPRVFKIENILAMQIMESGRVS